jgi:hypothetical protein
MTSACDTKFKRRDQTLTNGHRVIKTTINSIIDLIQFFLSIYRDIEKTEKRKIQIYGLVTFYCFYSFLNNSILLRISTKNYRTNFIYKKKHFKA